MAGLLWTIVAFSLFCLCAFKYGRTSRTLYIRWLGWNIMDPARQTPEVRKCAVDYYHKRWVLGRYECRVAYPRLRCHPTCEECAERAARRKAA